MQPLTIGYISGMLLLPLIRRPRAVSDNELKQHLDERFDRVDARLTRVEEKLDDHLQRLSTAEASIEWLRGHAKIFTTIILAAAGFLASLYFNK